MDFQVSNKPVDINGLDVWIEDAHNWQVELGCINYLLSQILERKVRNGENCFTIIDLVYKFENQLFFRIHECDHRLVEYMLRHVRQYDCSLEDELVTFHNRMCEHIYE